MTEIVSVILAFVLTGVIGNRLLQNWQERTWLRQRQFLGLEKEYTSLRDLTFELTEAGAARLFRMRRLLAATRSLPVQELQTRLKDYDEALVTWNEKLNGFYVRLAFIPGHELSIEMERSVHKKLAVEGARIEKLVRVRLKGGWADTTECASIDHALNHAQAALLRFNKRMLRLVDAAKKRVYFGESIPYRSAFIFQFSTMELIKALFIRDVDGHSVFRPAEQLVRPRFRGR